MLGLTLGPSWLRRLDLRIVMFLTVALLPLGAVSVYQSLKVSRAAVEQSRLSLQLLTAQAAAGEWRIIEGAFGAAKSLSATVPLFVDDSAVCARLLTAYLSQSPNLAFVGFVPLDGIIRCSSTGQVHDLSGMRGFDEWMRSPYPNVVMNRDAAITRQPALIVNHPVFEAERFLGYMSISVPHDAVELREIPMSEDRGLEIFTFSSQGQVLTASAGLDGVERRLPADRPLTEFVSGGATSFSAEDGNGERSSFAVVPIVVGSVYALGRWDEGLAVAGPMGLPWAGALVPLMMWAISLLVACIAMHRLVIRHVRALQAKMRAFALHRKVPPRRVDPRVPVELADMERTLARMTEIVLRDEADLENSVHERNVLLKEVHHRVKNNLQLISSMMSMQIRKVTQQETRTILKRLQDRILGLAAIHRSLYQTTHLSRVRADVLISDLVRQIMIFGTAASEDIDLHIDVSEVTLYPDQVMPLSLLANEAVTNALKHSDRTGPGRPWLRVELHQTRDGRVRFSTENCRCEKPARPAPEVDGLGTRLITAFAQQLGATPETCETASRYRLSVVFDVRDFEPQTEAQTEDEPGAMPAAASA